MHCCCRDSPFLHDDNSGGGFVGDKDIVALQAVEYSSQESSGGLGHNACRTQNSMHCCFLLWPKHASSEEAQRAGSACLSGFTDDDGTCLVLPEFAIRSGPRKDIYWDPSQVWLGATLSSGLWTTCCQA